VTDWAGSVLTGTALCVQELALPHQIRSMTFPNPKTLFLGFSTSEYGIVSLSTATPSLSELFVPASVPVSSNAPSGGLGLPGLGGLGGLALKTGGYMGIGGIGRVARNSVVHVGKGEVIILRESMPRSPIPSYLQLSRVSHRLGRLS
jgi:hypothetical protein